MLSLEHLVLAVISIAFPPFMLLVFALILFSSLGWTLGIREIYVQILLKVFEWGRQKIEMQYDANKYDEDDEINPKIAELNEETIAAEVIAPASITDDRVVDNETVKPLLNGGDRVPVNEKEEIASTFDPQTASEHATDQKSFLKLPTSQKTLQRGISNGIPRANSVNERARKKLSENMVIQKKTFCEAPTNITLSERLFDEHGRESDESSSTGSFQPGDIADYARWAMEAITEDEVTKRFSAAELSSWNLMTRTNQQYHFLSLRLTVLWAIGFVFRYTILLPLRIMIGLIGVVWLITCTAFIGFLPENSDFKRRMSRYTNLMCFRIVMRSFSAVLNFHDVQNRPRENAICVANHTSPIDAVLLAADNCYEFIGQRHGGFFGMIQRALSRGSEQIWFERSEMKDREAVTRKLRAHVNTQHALPILIFPEGTCINNTSVMMFKKGSFELDCDVYPVAIKYDQRFGDAFWDSSKFNFLTYIYRIMTSWALVADVMYLPKMHIREGEDSVQFANRVKKEIARSGGFVDLEWDGGLKRSTPKAEWKQAQQKYFSERFVSHPEQQEDKQE